MVNTFFTEGSKPHPESNGVDLNEIYRELNNFFTEAKNYIEELISGEKTWEDLPDNLRNLVDVFLENLKNLIDISDKGFRVPHILDGLTEEEKEQIKMLLRNESPQNYKALGTALNKIASKIRQAIEWGERKR
jgi:hypothetical protein